MASRIYMKVRKAAFQLLEGTPDCRMEFLAGFLYQELLREGVDASMISPELARVMAVRALEDWERLRCPKAAP